MKYYDGVMQRVKKIEEKNGIFYARPGGKLYNAFKWVYILTFIYGAFNALAFILGISIRYKDFLSDFLVDLLTPGISLLLMLIGLILLLTKVHIVGTVLNCVPATMMIFFFRDRLIDEMTIDGVYPKFYWRHLAPMVLVILCALGMCIIAVRAAVKTKNLYTRVTENLYNLYKVNVSDGEDVSEEQWDEFLQRYDPFNYKSQFLNIKEAESQSEGQSDT